jgi:hypothetical protein
VDGLHSALSCTLSLRENMKPVYSHMCVCVCVRVRVCIGKGVYVCVCECVDGCVSHTYTYIVCRSVVHSKYVYACVCAVYLCVCVCVCDLPAFLEHLSPHMFFVLGLVLVKHL